MRGPCMGQILPLDWVGTGEKMLTNEAALNDPHRLPLFQPGLSGFCMNMRHSCSASLIGSVETVESVISQTMLQSFYYVLVCKSAPKVFYDFGCYDATNKCPLLLFSPSLMMCSALSFHWLPIFSKLFYCPCYPGHSPVLLLIVYCRVHIWWHRQRMKDRNIHWSQRLWRSC